MARPPCLRRIGAHPAARVFGPAGAACDAGGCIELTLDEFEALRLADLEALYQADAARRMGISRATFGRVLQAAHRKVALALLQGTPLRIEGGPVTPDRTRRRCGACARELAERPDVSPDDPPRATPPPHCPRCRKRGGTA